MREWVWRPRRAYTAGVAGYKHRDCVNYPAPQEDSCICLRCGKLKEGGSMACAFGTLRKRHDERKGMA